MRTVAAFGGTAPFIIGFALAPPSFVMPPLFLPLVKAASVIMVGVEPRRDIRHLRREALTLTNLADRFCRPLDALLLVEDVRFPPVRVIGDVGFVPRAHGFLPIHLRRPHFGGYLATDLTGDTRALRSSVVDTTAFSPRSVVRPLQKDGFLDLRRQRHLLCELRHDGVNVESSRREQGIGGGVPPADAYNRIGHATRAELGP